MPASGGSRPSGATYSVFMIPYNSLIALPALAVATSSFPAAQAALMPLVVAALLLDTVIISVWYMLGIILNNSTVKISARGEFYQLLGTAILIAILLSIFLIFSQTFFSLLNSSSTAGGLMSNSTLGTMCSNIESTTKVNALTSGGLLGTICSYITGRADSLTYRMGYPLAASDVIIANLTNQTAFNLNNLFIVDSYLGFLSKLSPTFSICISGEVDSPVCLVPLPIPPPAFDSTLSATPYAGFDLVYKGFSSLGALMTLSFESFIVQLGLSTMFLFIWPALLFVGIVLRATFFTRKIGGLFIAIAIGAIIFYPLVFSIQYLTLGRGLGNITGFGNVISANPNSISSIYGFNSITSNSLTAIPGYTPNFYVEPAFNNIAYSTGCWPGGSSSVPSDGALGAEVTDIGELQIPFVSLVELLSSLYGSFVSGYPSMSLTFQCTASQAQNTLFAFLNAYGIYGISAYLLPILNILIVVSAIIGLSGLLGGDTQLAGLSKLI